MLTVDDVIFIHGRIAAARESQSVSATQTPNVSVKSRHLLESAIGRQSAGAGDRLFYPTPQLNAASLMFGLAKNHPFHDGNKRTAVVSMLNHLDRNRLTICDVRWQDLESVVLDLVLGTLPSWPALRHAAPKSNDRNERNLLALGEWIRQNSRPVERRERLMTYDDLEPILRRYGYEFGNPHKNSIPICRVFEENYSTIFGRAKSRIARTHILTIPYPGGKRTVDRNLIRSIRRACHLTDEHGVDSSVFYDERERVDAIINAHRTLLRSLERK